MTNTEITLIVLVVFLSLVILSLVFFVVSKEKRRPQANQEEDIYQIIDENNNKVRDEVNQALQSSQLQQQKQMGEMQTNMLLKMQESMSLLSQNINANLREINERVHSSFESNFNQTKDSIVYLEHSLTEIKETQKNLDVLQKDMVNLANLFAHSQSRGRYGEMQLELLLKDIFGDTKGKFYDYQYTLDGTKLGLGTLRPDAVVFLQNGAEKTILAIDSKFSVVGFETLFNGQVRTDSTEGKEALAQLKIALKKRIDETSKYIIEGVTIDESVMFIPADSMYAFIASELSELFEYARKKKVLLTSPTILPPLLASLRLILLQEEKNANAKEIVEELSLLSVEFHRFSQRYEVLFKNIHTLEKNGEELATTVKKINKRFENIKDMQFDNKEGSDENNFNV